jgi:thymidylate synthase (FAD)
MKLVKASFEILTPINGLSILQAIEAAARTCYKSEKLSDSPEDTMRFVKSLMHRGHESPIEHQSVTVRVITDRGVSHEIVRHRLASYSQESTRFCNYGSSGVTFVIPCFFDIPADVDEAFQKIIYNLDALTKAEGLWLDAMCRAEIAYIGMLGAGCSPQQARSVLPNSVKTEIVMTMNLREWRHFFKLRALGLYGTPHPQMLEIAVPLLKWFQAAIPVVFDDLQMIKNAE